MLVRTAYAAWAIIRDEQDAATVTTKRRVAIRHKPCVKHYTERIRQVNTVRIQFQVEYRTRERERGGGERVVLTHLWAHPMEAVVSQRCGAAVRLVAVGVAVAAPRPPN